MLWSEEFRKESGFEKKKKKKSSGDTILSCWVHLIIFTVLNPMKILEDLVTIKDMIFNLERNSQFLFLVAAYLYIILTSKFFPSNQKKETLFTTEGG